MRPEVITIIKALANKHPSAIAKEKKILEMMADQQDLSRFIEEFKKEIHQTKDPHDDRLPFYNFYLAVALLEQNQINEAKDALSDAVRDFQILGWTLNEAMGEWLFSTIHYEKEDYARARQACERAIEILQDLIQQYSMEGKYEHVNEVSTHLVQLEIFQDNIIIATSSKSLLQNYKIKLENEIEYLKRHKKRIRPTLVAKDFYVYKMMTPAHIVYSRVPDPKTEREKMIYEDLLSKVGFFEIIVTLEALEREFAPTATREELLNRINQEWDRDVKR